MDPFLDPLWNHELPATSGDILTSHLEYQVRFRYKNGTAQYVVEILKLKIKDFYCKLIFFYIFGRGIVTYVSFE